MEQQDQNKRRRGYNEDTAWLHAWSIQGRLVENLSSGKKKKDSLSSTALQSWLPADSFEFEFCHKGTEDMKTKSLQNLEDLWGLKTASGELVPDIVTQENKTSCSRIKQTTQVCLLNRITYTKVAVLLKPQNSSFLWCWSFLKCVVLPEHVFSLLHKGRFNGVLIGQDSCHLALDGDNRHRSLDWAEVTLDDTSAKIMGD